MNESKEVELVLSMINLHSKIQRRIGGPLSAHGLGLTEFMVLRQLHAAPNQKMRRVDLAERVGLSPSGITRLLNPMEKIGLIQKETNNRDARVSLVGLSSAGKRILKDAQPVFVNAAAELLAPLDSREQELLSGYISSLA